ncbi:MAG: hypothetical protein IVW57_12860, partial [Ktedonobacterales bacterium]|nr:hypothetical protein [Ktedonobacterales bacterium]
ACAVLGLALGALLLGPGRLASEREAARLEREVARLNGVTHTLEQRQAALWAERDTLRAERDHLRMRVAQLARAGGPTASGGLPLPGEDQVMARSASPGGERVSGLPHRTDDATAPERPPRSDDSPTGTRA